MGGVIQGVVGDLRNQGLTAGARNGSLNREEFVALNGEANGIAAMRERFSEGGINPFEQAVLNQRNDRYEQQYERYTHGDYHPATFAKHPGAALQLAQSGQIYDGLQSGAITNGESADLLREQRDIARQGGSSGFFQQAGLNARLNQSSAHIFEAKHNWSRQLPSWF